MQQNFTSFSDSKNTVIKAPGFSAALSLDCGQAFRWSADENGLWHGVAFGKALTLAEKDGEVLAIAVLAEDSGSGNETAVPIAKNVLNAYYNR